MIVERCSALDIKTRLEQMTLIKEANQSELRQLAVDLQKLPQNVRIKALPIVFDLVKNHGDEYLHRCIFRAADSYPMSEILLSLPTLISLFLKCPRYQDYERLPSIIEKRPKLSDIQLLDFILPSLVGAQKFNSFVWILNRLSNEQIDLFFARPKALLAAGNREALAPWVETIPKENEEFEEWANSFPALYGSI